MGMTIDGSSAQGGNDMATRTEARPTDALVREAKDPVTPIAGPYGHPFHPIFVTIPIGAWICALIFDIASRVKDNGSPTLVDAAYWLIGIGIIGALVAAIFGLLDLLSIPRRTRAFATGLTHMSLNLIVVALFVVNFIWRHNDHLDLAKVRVGQLVLSAVAVAILAVSGWLGGTLAYHFGVRVADQTTQADGFRK
jgi:uncharacterized membrane protein